MSLNRYARRVDENHREIVQAFRAMGCSVEAIHGTTGCPDLLVGCFGIDQLVEVKPDVRAKARRETRDTQDEWHAKWRGRKPIVVRNVDDCAALVAMLRGALTRSEVSRG